MLFENLDSNKNNTIDYTEFVMAAVDRKKTITDEKIKTVFKMFDHNEDGIISINELKENL